MSSYLKDAINPETKKKQLAYFYDDFYAPHQYGVGFRLDGEDAKITDEISPSIYVFYPEEYFYSLKLEGQE